MRRAAALGLLLLAVPALGQEPTPAPPAPAAATERLESVNPGLREPASTVRRATPRETVFGFIDAARAGQYELAAHYLNLAAVPPERQATEGPRLARRLKFVLDQTLWLDPELVADDAAGHLDDGLPPSQERIGAIPLRAGETIVRLRRYERDDGEPVWLFSPATVAAIDDLYRVYGVGWIGDRLPAWMLWSSVGDFQVWQIAALLVLFPFAYVIGTLIARLASHVFRKSAARTRLTWDDALSEIVYAPVKLLAWAGLLGIASTWLKLSVPARELMAIGVRTAVIVAIALFAFRSLGVLAIVLAERLSEGQIDDNRRRGIQTQVNVLQRLAGAVVWIVMIALVLAQFPAARTIGVSLLASAGIAGAVLGFAAQSSVANMFAGIQIMLTQPIRIGDVVIVEGEWGRIEEINFTHVQVKIWDLRRLVVPISYFLQRPFQNWTRVSPELLGTIFFYTDHSVDVEAMRRELDRILAATPLWDGKVKGIVVTDIKEHVVEVRALVSAADSGAQWDLRCLVREKLLAWIQGEGNALPRLRISPPSAADRERLAGLATAEEQPARQG